MKCKHEFELIEVKDAPELGIYTVNDGLQSARYEKVKCKKCGKIETRPKDL